MQNTIIEFVKGHWAEFVAAVAVLLLIRQWLWKKASPLTSRLKIAYHALTSDKYILVYWKESFGDDVRYSWGGVNRVFLEFVPKLYKHLSGRIASEQKPVPVQVPVPAAPPTAGPLGEPVVDELAAAREKAAKKEDAPQ